MHDYCSISPTLEWIDEHKVCSIPPGVLALAESMIELAISDIVNIAGRDHALAWIMAKDRSYQFSFLNCCGILGINPVVIRSAVNAYLAGNHERKRRKGRKV